MTPTSEPARGLRGLIGRWAGVRRAIAARLCGWLHSARRWAGLVVPAVRGTDARGRAAEAWDGAQDQADNSPDAASRSLAHISHELRTPLNGIIGLASLLEDSGLDKRQQNYVGAIRHSARTLLELIDETLDLAKIEAGKVALTNEPFALDQLVQDVVELLAPNAHNKGLELGWALEPNLPKRVVGDALRVRQILTNLLGNAIKFTEEGGVLVAVSGETKKAETEVEGEGERKAPERLILRLEVCDTGIGLDADARQAVFDAFAQGARQARGCRDGTGLGLAISRQLARAMGGDIEVESTPGKGATFRATLALGLAADARFLSSDWQCAARARHILIVSRRPIEARALKRLLTTQGHRVTCKEPPEAHDVVAQQARLGTHFNVLIVDSALPTPEAKQLVALAREASPERVRALVTLAPADRPRLADWSRAGFDAYLMRPVRPSSLFYYLRTDATVAPHSRTGEQPRYGETGAGETADKPRGRPAPIDKPTAAVVPTAASAATATTAASAASATMAPLHWRGRRILLAEDDDVSALLAERLLASFGLTVVRARSGLEAIEALEVCGHGAPFSLVLMDLYMPEMDGFTTSREIKRRLHAGTLAGPLPVIALSANRSDEEGMRWRDAGFDDHITKPLDGPALTRILERWCDPAQSSAPHGALASSGSGNDGASAKAVGAEEPLVPI